MIGGAHTVYIKVIQLQFLLGRKPTFIGNSIERASWTNYIASDNVASKLRIRVY